MRSTRTPHLPAPVGVLSAALCGVAYGAFTERIEGAVDCPAWFEIWHGVAPWGLVTLFAGLVVGGPLAQAVTAGFATQVGLIVGYYLASGDAETYQLVTYGGGAIVFGPLYGAAGASLGDRTTRHRWWVVGLVGAPSLIDGVHLLWEATHPDYTVSNHVLEMTMAGVVSASLGVVLLVWLSRSWGGALGAASVAGSMAAVFVAMLHAGLLD